MIYLTLNFHYLMSGNINTQNVSLIVFSCFNQTIYNFRVFQGLLVRYFSSIFYDSCLCVNSLSLITRLPYMQHEVKTDRLQASQVPCFNSVKVYTRLINRAGLLPALHLQLVWAVWSFQQFSRPDHCIMFIIS